MAMAGWLLRRAAELRRDFTWREAGGSLGDLGTFIPLLVGLTAECGLDVGTTLVFTGLYNLATALAFDVPMPLQPMKTIAAVAMTDPPMDVPQIVAAGGFVALVVLVLGCTGLMERFNAVTPFGVVRGCSSGSACSCAPRWTLAVWTDGTRQSMRGLWGPDGMALARSRSHSSSHPRRREDGCGAREVVGDGAGVGADRTHARARGGSGNDARVALSLVAVGAVIAACRPGSLASLRAGPSTPTPAFPSAKAAATGVLRAGLPQLPLTTLNSVVATCALSKDLFPDKPFPVRPTGVAVSVGAMNLCGVAFGVMPCCHGAGGLAAHYRFGARTGAATAFLGAGKLFLGVAFGGSLLTLLGKFPAPLLGVLLAAASAELIRAGLDGATHNEGSGVDSWYDPGWTDRYALIVTAATTVGSGSTGLGALFGFATHALGTARRRLLDTAGGEDLVDGREYREVEMERGG